MRVIEPLWTTKPETAGRLRGRIEAILDWSRVRGYRTGENPARWKGHLDHLLPARNKVRKVEHHAAMPYVEIGAFMAESAPEHRVPAVRLSHDPDRDPHIGNAQRDVVARSISTGQCGRSPAERMKAGKAHRVPLSDAALAVLKAMRAISTGDYVFPGRNGKKPLHNMALLMVLRRMNRGDLTGHGFRSSFRVWAAEQTNFPCEVAEAALAHAVSDKVIAAYVRTTS